MSSTNCSVGFASIAVCLLTLVCLSLFFTRRLPPPPPLSPLCPIHTIRIYSFKTVNNPYSSLSLPSLFHLSCFALSHSITLPQISPPSPDILLYILCFSLSLSSFASLSPFHSLLLSLSSSASLSPFHSLLLALYYSLSSCFC